MSVVMPCWSRDQVLRIVTPDAEEISDHVFRAVHCPTELQLADNWNGPRYVAPAETLIERFLDPERRYVQAVVLGESGTGKSHLIQWLRLNLPQRSEDLVLTIPKVGTSLRGIVQRIVNRLPEESRAPFEDKLRTAGSQTTTHQARVDKFMFSLAWSVQHAVAPQSNEEAELAEMLPSVLSDPNFRRGFFSVAGGTVDQIVRHIFDHPEGREDTSARRQFQLGDLPLGGEHYRDAALMARDAIDFIRGEASMEQSAIELMTRALEPAIAQTLNFTADDLIELMRELRIHLAQQGKRLVLLIEDFARLQGIDTALLQALVTPPRQEEEKLCELRWAMAVTTGYFRSRFDETVRTRATFVVDMDRSQPASVPQFAAGYMNAIRVGETALLETPVGDAVTNPCTNCSRQAPCWEAFGQEGGVGLFPFNATALNAFADRSGARQDDGFNPRTFLKAVLAPVMNEHYGELVHAQFPSRALLRRVGGENRLRAQIIADLERRDPVLAERRVSLLELWDGSGKLVNLHPGIHEAFGLPVLPDVAASPPPDGPDAHPLGPEQPPLPAESPLVFAIHQWATDSETLLAQSHVSSLRLLIYAALDGFIDWDALGVQKSYATSAFRTTSINFARQQTARARTAVSLELPFAGQSIAQTAVALEALVRADNALDWEVEYGTTQLATLLNELQRWADEITSQLQQLFRGDAHWNPITAAVEVLTLALLQSGKVKINDRVETIAVKLFDRGTPPAMTALTPAFRDYSSRLLQNYESTRGILKALCSGTKGGKVGNFTRMLPVLQAIRALRRRHLTLTQAAPAEASSQELKPLVNTYSRLMSGYGAAFDAEIIAWREWLARVRAELGTPERRPSELVETVVSLLTEVENAGLDLGIAREVLRTHLASLPSLRALDQAADHWAQIESAVGVDALVRCALASTQRMPLEKLFNDVDTVATKLEARVSGELRQIDIDVGEGLRRSKATIKDSLGTCVAALDGLETLQEVV